MGALIRSKKLPLENLKHFVLDECDKMLEQPDMRRDVQEIFRATPHEKQVMMFSATLSKDIRPVCKKFMQDPMEVYIDDEAKLTLHGLQQHYVKLKDSEKNRKLFELLDVLEFNQVVIFVKSVQRCVALASLLIEQNFPAIAIHRGLAGSEPRVWPSPSSAMRETPRSSTKYRTGSRWTSPSCRTRSTSAATLRDVKRSGHQSQLQ